MTKFQQKTNPVWGLVLGPFESFARTTGLIFLKRIFQGAAITSAVPKEKTQSTASNFGRVYAARIGGPFDT